MNKFSTPYSAVPLTVIDKKHSMITAENAQRKVTRNASFFKKVHPNTAMPDSQDPPPADDVNPPLNVSHPSKALEESRGRYGEYRFRYHKMIRMCNFCTKVTY